MYDVKDEDFEGAVDQSRLSTNKESSPLQMQLPVLELLKVCALIFLFRFSKYVGTCYLLHKNVFLMIVILDFEFVSCM